MLLPFSIEPLIDFPLIDLPLMDLPLIDLPFVVTTSTPRARAESSFAALPPQAATRTAATQAIARGPLIRTDPEMLFLADILFCSLSDKQNYWRNPDALKARGWASGERE